VATVAVTDFRAPRASHRLGKTLVMPGPSPRFAFFRILTLHYVGPQPGDHKGRPYDANVCTNLLLLVFTML